MTREEATRWVRSYVENGFAVVWTDGKSGDAAKRVNRKLWQATPPLAGEIGALAGEFSHWIKRANPAVVTGTSGLVSIDCDDEASLKRYAELGLPETLSVRSSPGRGHFHFRAPPEVEDTFFEFKAGTVQGVSTKYLLLPPAVHPSGVHYSIVNGAKIADLPQAAYEELVRLSGATRRKITKAAATPGEKIPVGSRHDFLHGNVWRLANTGLSEDAVVVAVRDLNTNRLEQPLPADEVERDARRSYASFLEKADPPQLVKTPPIGADVEELPPWDGDLAGLLAETCKFTRRYIVLGKDETRAFALWIGHTYIWEHLDYTPYLDINSAVRQCGKSHLQDVAHALVSRGYMAADMSPASLYQFAEKAEQEKATLFLDEVDAIFGAQKNEKNEALRGLLNSGFEQGRESFRVGGKDKNELLFYKTFCPKCFATIGQLPDTIASRSIRIRMHRKRADEKVVRLRKRKLAQKAAPLRARWRAWAQSVPGPEFFELEDERIPAEIDGRAADIWEPLLAIADAAGGQWPTETRRAAVRLSTNGDVEDESAGIHLLTDIRKVFAAEERLASKDLLAKLTEDEEGRWVEWSKGKPLSARGLSRLLHPFEIKPKQLRIDGANVRGYAVEQFQDAFSRYLPPLDATSATTRMDTAIERDFPSGTDSTCTASKKPANPHEQRDVADVADKTPPDGMGELPEDLSTVFDADGNYLG